jgi:hypothetical protein
LAFRVSGNQHRRASAANTDQMASDDLQPPAKVGGERGG